MARIGLLSLAALAVVSGPGVAQQGPRVVPMTLHPAGPSVPAMRYQLLPDLRDIHPGNAALAYYRAFSPEWYPNFTRHPEFTHFQEWLDLPLAKAPLEEVYSGVTINMLRELDRGARLESCDWQMLPRLRQDSLAMLIPDLQGFRPLSVALALRGRLELRERTFDKAVYTLQTGLTLGKHVGEGPTLVGYLIGNACTAHMLQVAEEFVQQPGAPNLYWALTDLPRPLIDVRRPLQGERVMVDALFPEVRAALHDPKTPPVPLQTLHAQIHKLALLGMRIDDLTGAVNAATAYPRARKYFLEHGRTAEQVDALSLTQVTLMYALTRYDVWAEDFYKLNNLPYWEARPRLKALQAQWHATDREEKVGMGFATALFFNPERIYGTKAFLQRRVDLLRCVEAIRLHAAAHSGTLPAALADIDAVPMPIDAVTGKSFTYRKDGDRAILEAPAPPGEEAGQHNAVRIEITVAAGKKGS
jgi:hypothetical protein